MNIEVGVIEGAQKKKGKINTPFGYFGSKNKLAQKFCENLPPHYCWVELFCGSASLTLNKSKAPIEIINDIDAEIINFFKQLRNKPKDLCNQVFLTPYSEQELIEARVENEEDNDLERARKFLVQSMMAINGVFGEHKGGFSSTNSYARNNNEARVNRWNNLPERLMKVVERLKTVRIENKDALKLFKKFINRPATLVYIDPPYLGDRTKGYNIDANDIEFHVNLLNQAISSSCMVFISGYENELYNSLLTNENGWEKKIFETNTKDTKGGVHERLEVVWMNRYFTSALESNKVPIELTDDEKKNNKINPERF